MKGRENEEKRARVVRKSDKKEGKTAHFATHGCPETQKQPLPLRRDEGGYRLRQFFYFEGRPLLEWRARFPAALPEGATGADAAASDGAAAKEKGRPAREKKKRGAHGGQARREGRARERIDGYYRRLAEGMREAIKRILLPKLEKEMAEALAARRRAPVYHLICEACVVQDGGGYFSALRELRLLRGGHPLFRERTGEIFSLADGRLCSPAALAFLLKGPPTPGTDPHRADKENTVSAAGQEMAVPTDRRAGKPPLFRRLPFFWRRMRRVPRVAYLREGRLAFCERTPPADEPLDLCHLL